MKFKISSKLNMSHGKICTIKTFIMIGNTIILIRLNMTTLKNLTLSFNVTKGSNQQ